MKAQPTQRESSRLLIVDAAPAMRQVLGDLLSTFYRLSLASSAAEAEAHLAKQTIDLVIVGAIPHRRSLIDAVQARDAALPVVMLSARQAASTTARIVPQRDLGNETGRARLLMMVERSLAAQRNAALRRDAATPSPVELAKRYVSGSSRPARDLQRNIDEAAASRLPALISGETGSGKTLIAACIAAAADPDGEHPFIRIDTTAHEAQDLAPTLFGHPAADDGSAISGAVHWARGGILFVDAVGELGADLQRRLVALASDAAPGRTPDPRLVAATGVNLDHAVQEGGFRRDLYERLRAIHVRVPALRERRTDIVPMLQALHSQDAGKNAQALELDPLAEKWLTHYDWPGNVRELRHVALRLRELGTDGPVDESLLRRLLPIGATIPEDSRLSIDEKIRSFSRRAYLEALEASGYRLRETARALELPYHTLRSRLRSLDLLEVARTKRRSH